MRYLAHTPEFRAALDGYMEELRRMLDAPIYLGPSR